MMIPSLEWYFVAFLLSSHLQKNTDNSEQVNVTFPKMTYLLVPGRGWRMKTKTGTNCS